MREIIKNLATLSIEGKVSQVKAISIMLNVFKTIEESDEKNIKPVGKSRIHKLIALDGNKCFFCGIETKLNTKEIQHDRATVDHLLPSSLGGIDNIDNCVLSCFKCNSTKGNNGLYPYYIQKPNQQ